VQPNDRAQQRRLTGAVRAEERYEFATRDARLDSSEQLPSADPKVDAT
jgi:hypothetical protein